MKRREAKKEAVQTAAALIQMAAATAPSDMDLAKAQAILARRVMLKFNVRYDWSLRRFFCHGCKGLLYPGINARVRLGPGRFLLVTCGDCGYVNRKKITKHA
ncbi:MAG: ribonuclease P [Thaumarchaeota archaeon]|nr:ribonuclease P [Nitrososphaerota archaeon]